MRERNVHNAVGQPDSALLLARVINDKDSDAFTTLYCRYYLWLERHIARRINYWLDAEDLAQSVFVQLWETGAHYEIQKPAEAYLIAVANNTIAQQMRREKRHQRCVPVNSAADTYADGRVQCGYGAGGHPSHRQIYGILANAADRLTPKAYEALRLRFLEGLSVRQAARAAGCTVSAFYARLERAIKALEAIQESV